MLGLLKCFSKRYTHDYHIVIHIQFGDYHNVTPLQSESNFSCVPPCPALDHPIAPLDEIV